MLPSLATYQAGSIVDLGLLGYLRPLPRFRLAAKRALQVAGEWLACGVRVACVAGRLNEAERPVAR